MLPMNAPQGFVHKQGKQMKVKLETIENTFVLGVSFSNSEHYTNLIFDLGKYSLAFSHKKKSN